MRRYFPEDCTPEEIKAIRALERLAKIWPPTIKLFSASGSLVVVEAEGPNTHVLTPIEGVGSLHRIINDGGDPDWTAD